MSNYTMIATSAISAHENNPRKEIVINDEFKELVASIKANGILQHLTVVPFEEGYKCVIGHRRLAAAKKAGLKEVPCFVADMTEEEQLHTMMMENMQRSDLTAREQALGFQMMIDMGESMSEIAKQTGFSKTTISHRTKMLKLDDEKMKEAETRGATIADYIRLEEIKDIDVRNSVLDYIGTNNFDYQLKRALENQKHKETLENYEKECAKFATKIETAGKLKTEANVDGEDVPMFWVASFGYNDTKPVEYIASAEYFYVVSNYYVSLYQKGERPVVEEAPEKKMERELAKLKSDVLEAARDRCKSLRTEFVKDFSALKKNFDKINKFYFQMSMGMMGTYSTWQITSALQDLVEVGEEEDYNDVLLRLYETSPEQATLYAAYAMACTKNCLTWTQKWEKSEMHYEFHRNGNLDELYKFLQSLGYQMSDYEISYCAGEIEEFKALLPDADVCE